ncbi:MAG: NADH-quinone oxidoreductase subunit N [bacterium]
MNLHIELILPQLIITGTAILVLLLSLGNKSIRKSAPYLSIIGVMIALWYSMLHWESARTGFSYMVISDGYTYFFNILFLAGTGLVILISMRFVSQEKIIEPEYYTLILFATLGMMVMAGSTDLIVLFLGLELLSIPLYILASIKRSELKGNESALKYLLLGAFAAGFLLYGIALIYGATGTTNLTKIITATPAQSGNTMFLIGTVLILIGFGFKVGIVPFHTWIPDVYEGSSTAITSFMAIGPKAAGFAALLRVMIGLPAITQTQISTALWWLAVLTMTLGNLVALRQENIKRMLAYSSIAHAGYILVGLIAGPVPPAVSRYNPVLFYLIVYTLMNLGAFTIVMLIERSSLKTENRQLTTNFAGSSTKHPFLAFAMSVFMISLAGIPPTGGFMAKFYLFKSAVDAGYVGLVIIAVLNSVISVYYYLRIVVLMYMKPAESEFAPIEFPHPVSFVLTLCTLGIIYLGVYPAFIIIWIKNLF